MNYNGLRKLSYFVYIDHERLQMSFMMSQRCSYVSVLNVTLFPRGLSWSHWLFHTHLVSWMCLEVEDTFPFYTWGNGIVTASDIL